MSSHVGVQGSQGVDKLDITFPVGVLLHLVFESLRNYCLDCVAFSKDLIHLVIMFYA